MPRWVSNRVPASAIVAMTAACVWAVSAGDRTAQERQSDAGRIETAISAFMKKMHIPAMSVAVVKDNEIRFNRGYGVADLEHAVPASAATVYRIASISKPLTAVAAMQLAERGDLDLDAPVQKYAAAFPIKPFPITTRQVLAHLAGIRGYRPGEAERTERFENLVDALSVFKDDPLEQEPGTRFTYSTFGYTLLGAIIEGASRMRFDEYMRERVFKPAGMGHTRADDVFAIVPQRARGYTPAVYAVFDGNYRNASLMDSSYKRPGGGFLSTAEDLARFAIGLQRAILLRTPTLQQMSQNQTIRDGSLTGYGLGWYIDGRPGRTPNGSISHGGVQPGFTGDLWLIPKREFAIAILANLEGGGRLGLATLANEIAEVVLQPR